MVRKTLHNVQKTVHIQDYSQKKRVIFQGEGFLVSGQQNVDVYMLSQSLSHVWLFAHQDPPSMDFSRQEYWSRLPFHSPGDLSDPGIKPRCPALQADSLPSEPLEIPTKKLWIKYIQNILVIIACSDFSFLKSLWGGKEEEKEKERNRDERENFLPIYLFAAGFSGGSEGKESA